MGTRVSYLCGTDEVASELILAVALLADPAFEEWLKKEYPWVTAGIQKFSNFTSGLLGRNEGHDTTNISYDSIQPYLSCLGLAAETRPPFELTGVLRFIHQFECTDKRDRLYGTLGLIKWRMPYGWNQAIAKPTPDYEKNAFRLAAEVFCMLYFGGKETISYALSWAQQLFEIFGLDPKDPTIREALVKRYSTTVKVDPHMEDEGENRLDHSKDPFWRSMRICDSSSLEAREPYSLHCAESAAEEEFVTLLDHYDVPFAQAPLQTSVGDFYIEMDRWTITPKSWANLGIIIKGTPKLFENQNIHSLIGLARRFPSQTGLSRRAYESDDHRKYKFVDMYWDVDDIFLLYLSTLVQAELPIEYLVKLRLCDPEREDSSFARLQ
jgi:hypothetical protein